MARCGSVVILVSVALVAAFATHALADAKKDAGKCVIRVTRTACPGKDKESFSKCNGKQSCDLDEVAATAADCATAALKACENTPDRQQITKSKTITALFGGQPVENGKNFCAADRPDFNKCTK